MIFRIKNILKKVNAFLINLRMVLEKNKIYFEILASFSVILIAIKANEISNQQISIQRELSQPHFEVEYDLTNKSLFINQNGGTFDDLSSSVQLRICLTYPDTMRLDYENYIYLYDDMLNYFSPKVGSPTTLYFINQYDTHYTSFAKSYLEYCEDKFGPDYGWSDFETYIMLSYIDIYGERKKNTLILQMEKDIILAKKKVKIYLKVNQGYTLILETCPQIYLIE